MLEEVRLASWHLSTKSPPLRMHHAMHISLPVGIHHTWIQTPKPHSRHFLRPFPTNLVHTSYLFLCNHSRTSSVSLTGPHAHLQKRPGARCTDYPSYCESFNICFAPATLSFV
jgi:hypothetical protein